MVRFDAPCLKVSGAVNYFREHMAGDYLQEQGQAEMTWQGEGASRLGLSGNCRLEDFGTLCQGQHPVTKTKLGVRDKGANRRVCFFAQISAPKDVSIACLVAGDKRIAGWWQEAVRETLKEIEAVTATRVRRGGISEDRTTGEMIAAVVTHDTNRALDPQLHTHVAIMNLTYDATEKRWKGVQPSAYFRHQGYFREVCYSKLAERLLQGGYQIEKVRGIGFNLVGFPPELRETFSKRRREILRVAQETGATTQDHLQAITAESRAEKSHTTAAHLRTGWIREAGSHLETAQRTVERATGATPSIKTVAPNDALASAEAHLFERRTVVEDRMLLREALIVARGRTSLADLKRALEIRIESGELLRHGNDIASRESLQAEEEFTGWCEAHRSGCAPLGQAPRSSELSLEQTQAVTDLLNARSRVAIFRGDAGTGKTTALRVVVTGIERTGIRVFGCAPSTSATDVLRQKLTPEADTLQKLLASPSLQEATRGSVIIVDEAGLIAARQMRDLCRLAARNQNRLILVGDTKQHTSVEAGDALRCLQTYSHIPTVRLTEIHRQTDPRYRQAVASLARGDAMEAFDQFKELGAVQQERSLSKLLANAAADYVKTVQAGKSCLVISPVWSEIRAFTAEVRTQLKAAGLLGHEERTVPTVLSLDWTREARRHAENYRPGDVLTFHRGDGGFAENEHVTVVSRDENSLWIRRADGREHGLDPHRVRHFEVGLPKDIQIAAGDRLLIRANLKSADLRNGDLVEVAGTTTDGGIQLKDGRSIPPWFRQVSHGYAATSHRSQGKTVQRGILIMADAGLAAGNLKQGYVSCSRFEESQMIYTTDSRVAREAMQRPADRQLASELATKPATAAAAEGVARAAFHPSHWAVAQKNSATRVGV